MLKASERSGVAPFMAMDVLAAAARLEAAGRRIIHMEVGQPGAPAPAAVLAAAAEALRGGRLVYTEACGIAPLRERIAHHYRERYGLDVAAERVIVTTGSSGGFTIAFLGAFDPGHPGDESSAIGTQSITPKIQPKDGDSATTELAGQCGILIGAA